MKQACELYKFLLPCVAPYFNNFVSNVLDTDLTLSLFSSTDDTFQQCIVYLLVKILIGNLEPIVFGTIVYC